MQRRDTGRDQTGIDMEVVDAHMALKRWRYIVRGHYLVYRENANVMLIKTTTIDMKLISIFQFKSNFRLVNSNISYTIRPTTRKPFPAGNESLAVSLSHATPFYATVSMFLNHALHLNF